MSILTEEQTKEILYGAVERLKESVIEQAKKQIDWSIKDAVQTNVSKLVTDFIKDEVAPEILVILESSKAVIIESAIMDAEEMAKMLATGMAETLAANLGTPYKRKKILEAMFD